MINKWITEGWPLFLNEKRKWEDFYTVKSERELDDQQTNELKTTVYSNVCVLI